jgi:hypothetical protein
MPSIRITRFAGLLTEQNPKALANDHAQIAHNCLLYDGYLRPMPQWTVDQVVSGATPKSLPKYPQGTNGYFIEQNLANAVINLGEPFDTIEPVGINVVSILPGLLATYQASGFGSVVSLGLPPPTITVNSQTITNNNLSVYPIARTYAVTYSSSNMEGPPTILPQIGAGGTLFEGDSVVVVVGLNTAELIAYNVTSINFYRTVPGFDTAEQLGNPLETGFHLVGSVSGVLGSTATLDDNFDSSLIEGDLLISDQWMPPPNQLNRASLFFGQTEGGWAVNARKSGTNHAPMAVCFSERYMTHAWPPQNFVLLPESITGMGIYYDDVFIGTQSVAYYIHVGIGEADALNIAVKPFVNSYACVFGTMVGTNFGAMYVAQDGIIALTAQGDSVASKRVANPGDTLNTGVTSFNFYSVTSTAWWDGYFIGFANANAFVYNQPNPSNQDFPLGQLTTIDTPSGAPGPNVVTGSGLFAAWGNTIYKLPLPGYGYQSAAKANFTWKSKRYVMPGLTTFAGIKVVNDNSGTLNVTFNGYNNGGESSPSFVYSRALNHSMPWRIPHQFKCLEFEIEVQGTSVVQEIHIASSYRDLIESPENG